MTAEQGDESLSREDGGESSMAQLLRRILRWAALESLWELARGLAITLAPYVFAFVLAVAARVENFAWSFVLGFAIFGATMGVWLSNGIEWRRQRRLTEAKAAAIARRIPRVESRAQREQLRAMYYSYAESAHKQIRAMLLRVCKELLNKEEPAARVVARMLSERIELADGSVTRLASALDADEIEEGTLVQEAFGDFFEHYQLLVAGVREGMSALFGQGQLEHYPDYKQWLAGDNLFLINLKGVVALSEFSVLRGRVRSIGWGEELRQDLV